MGFVRNLIKAFVALAVLAPLPVLGQTAPPPAAPLKTFISSGEVAALIARAKAMRTKGQALVVQRIKGATPYVALLEYREAATPPIVHENDSELFYVVQGSGTMMLGGKLIDEARVNLVLSATGEPVADETDKPKQASSPNLTGTGAEGGNIFPISKGEFIIVPPHTVHWFNSVNGTLVMVSLHAMLKAPSG